MHVRLETSRYTCLINISPVIGRPPSAPLRKGSGVGQVGWRVAVEGRAGSRSSRLVHSFLEQHSNTQPTTPPLSHSSHGLAPRTGTQQGVGYNLPAEGEGGVFLQSLKASLKGHFGQQSTIKCMEAIFTRVYIGLCILFWFCLG